MNDTTDFEELWRRGALSASHESWADLADQVLATCGPGRLLDVGCGDGEFVLELVRRGVDAHGIDIAATPVERARAALPGHFHQGSVFELPFADEAFESVSVLNLLERLHWDDVPKALGELHRAARRFVFVRVFTSTAPGYKTVAKREYWDEQFIAAGFRRHTRIFDLADYSSLDGEAGFIHLAYEKIPAEGRSRFAISRLNEERELHMDMLRASGRRADAHIARYAMARAFVRPNDRVLDLACGLGYGSAMLYDGTAAREVIGIDNSEFAIDYGRACYAPSRSKLRLELGDAYDLSQFADASVDCIVSFETVEHLEHPERFLAEAERILTPGGRFICSVPNLWVDEHGDDPNPHHHHVFDLAKLEELCGRHFLVEQVFRQVAGGGMTLSDRPRQMAEVARSERDGAEAEWWLLVGMKDPVDASNVPYRETTFEGVDTEHLNVVAFARDYQNPWLVRSMVSIGLRARSTELLESIAGRVLAKYPSTTPDHGAALCVLGYRVLEKGNAELRRDMVTRLEAFAAQPEGNPHFERWRISVAYLLGLFQLHAGDQLRARDAFDACASRDPLAFGPLLGTKSVDAAFHAGWLSVVLGDQPRARRSWNRGLELAQKLSAADWREIVGAEEHPLSFGLQEMTAMLDNATRCATGLRLLARGMLDRPGSFSELLHWNRQTAMGRIERRAEQYAAEASSLAGRLVDWDRRLLESDRERQRLEQQMAERAAAEAAAAEHAARFAGRVGRFAERTAEETASRLMRVPPLRRLAGIVARTRGRKR